MPRISDEYLDCVIYLYQSRDAAERGEAAGGTGFVVAYVSETVRNAFFLFAVSNKHVVADIGASVLRLNTMDGGVDIFDFQPHEWHSTNYHDLAIIGVKIDLSRHKVKAIPTSNFLTPHTIKTYDLGPGDEIFMIGRFVRHDGKLTNAPSVRFGNLSMMVDQIDHPSMGTQESFAVELRSMAGYSGSPVFVYPSAWNMNTGALQLTPPPLFLLGVDWGHILDHSEVRYKVVPTATQAMAPTRSVAYVASNTGMNGVVPAWRLMEMIKSNPWTKAVEAEDAKISSADSEASSGVALDGASTSPEPDNPAHREDFNFLVAAAAKKRPPTS